MKEKRFENIMKFLEEKEFCKVEDIANEFDVSLATVRRDLTELETNGLVKRLHGGVEIINSLNVESLEKNSFVNVKEKEIIAKRAASLIQDRENVYIDAGSSTFQMVKYIKAKDITIVTNGINIIDQLIKSRFNVVLLGGSIKFSTKAIIGALAVSSLDQFYFDRSFIGVNAVSFSNGCSTPDPQEADLKRKVILKSKRSYVLADSSKFNKSTFVKFADLKDVRIISDVNVDEYEEYIENVK